MKICQTLVRFSDATRSPLQPVNMQVKHHVRRVLRSEFERTHEAPGTAPLVVEAKGRRLRPRRRGQRGAESSRQRKVRRGKKRAQAQPKPNLPSAVPKAKPGKPQTLKRPKPTPKKPKDSQVSKDHPSGSKRKKEPKELPILAVPSGMTRLVTGEIVPIDTTPVSFLLRNKQPKFDGPNCCRAKGCIRGVKCLCAHGLESFS